MGGASSYIAILCIAAFMMATWLATKVSRAAGVSSIVLEIATGVAFGPSVLGLMAPEYAECQHKHHMKCEAPEDLHERVVKGLPLGGALGQIANMDYCPPADYSVALSGISTALTGSGRRLGGGTTTYDTYEECLTRSCEAEVRHHCQLTPDFFTLIGHAGVAMMIFESGMHFDFQKARVVGPWACVVAVIGTVMPLAAGCALAMAWGKPFMPDGISVGTSLAPTSVGISLRLLGEAGVLQKDFGQAIITAAFVDDIFSLVLFNILFSLGGDFDVVRVVVYPIIGVIFMIIAIIAAVAFWPWVINDMILPRIPRGDDENKVPLADKGLFFVMIMVLFAYATVTHFLGTHLWGCFIAGMSFACLQPPHHAHEVWVKQTKRATGWMVRIFFACTVAFSIPVSKLLSFDAFLKGTLMGLGPCILTKVLCAPFMGRARWVIGWAMVGRAEFAFLIAQMAAAADMVDEEMFSVVIWALIYAVIFAPFAFRFVLSRYIRSMGLDSDKEKAEEDKSANQGDKSFEPADSVTVDLTAPEGAVTEDKSANQGDKSFEPANSVTVDLTAPAGAVTVQTGAAMVPPDDFVDWPRHVSANIACARV